MEFDSGFRVYKKNNKQKAISSGDSTLDKLLNGGFQQNLVHLLYGDEKKTTTILLTTSVIVQKAFSNGGLGDGIRVAFVDGNNRFNPYDVSKFAVSKRLSPRKVLENILIARAFTWDQMVELLENRLRRLEDIKVILISGITNLFQSYEKKTFEDLLRAISGIKKILSQTHPLIVITAALHKHSQFRPAGGKILSHFGHVLVRITNDDRFVEYTLFQHPFLPEKREIKWKPRKPKRNLGNNSRNTTLDCWMK
jgi:RecA/RadA recombinase